MYKLVRIATVPESLSILLKGQHKFISQNGFSVLGVSSGGDVLQRVRQDEKIRIFPIEMSRKITPLRDIKSLWLMYFLLKREKPCIVHTHTPKAGIIGMIAAKMAGVPHRIHTVAGMPLMEAKGKRRILLNFVEMVTYACATKVYPNSKGLYDFILNERFSTERKLKIIANGSSNGIDTNYFNPNRLSNDLKSQLREILHISRTDFIFIFVGRLVGDKGVNELVSAFSDLSKKNVGLKLLLVGAEEKELDPLSPETIREIKKNKNVISVGYQKDVRPYFSVSDALVFPSYREGFPNVVMQAGAMELPSIVSDINGCNEIVEDGVNGIVVQPKKVDQLKEAMLKIVNDSNLFDLLQSHSRRMIVERYQQSVVWEALLVEYKHLLEEKC